MIDECLDTMRTVIERHAGRVIKAIGDEIMCTFPDADRGHLAARFWRALAQSAERYSPARHLPWVKVTHTFGLDHSPLYRMADIILRILSPYQCNPRNMNPLHKILEQHLDFAALRRHCPIHLYDRLVAAHHSVGQCFQAAFP